MESTNYFEYFVSITFAMKNDAKLHAAYAFISALSEHDAGVVFSMELEKRLSNQKDIVSQDIQIVNYNISKSKELEITFFAIDPTIKFNSSKELPAVLDRIRLKKKGNE